MFNLTPQRQLQNKPVQNKPVQTKPVQNKPVQNKSLKMGTALATALGLTVSTVAPLLGTLLGAAPALAQSRFSDVPTSHWAEGFISDLANRGVIAGFPDGRFQPNAPVTRAQYAAMVRNAFNKTPIRSEVEFGDVAANFWAAPAIDEAYTMGFLTGYPGNVFNPNQNIPRAQVLVSLANGLDHGPSNPNLVNIYQDAAAIPSYAVNSIAAATEESPVVNYPNVQYLNPNITATRADVAAFIYQALHSEGQVATITSPYIVSVNPIPTPTPVASLPQGTTISVAHPEAEQLVILPSETVPLTLITQENLVASGGQVVVPQGSQVVGEMRPVGQGTQFVAQSVILANGQRFPLNATSRRFTETETVDPDRVNTTAIATGAAVGAGAAAAIEGLTGNRTIGALEVLTGSAAGAVAGAIAGTFFGGDSVEVINLNPNQDLTLTLNRELVASAQ